MKNRSSLDRSRAAFQILREIAPGSDIDRFLQQTIAASLDTLGIDRAILFLSDGTGENFIQSYGVDALGNQIDEPCRVDRELLSEAMRGEVISRRSSASSRRDGTSPEEDDHGPDQLLLSPLRVDGTTVGVVYLDADRSPGMGDEEQKRYLTLLAGYLAHIIASVVEIHARDSELSYLKQRLTEESIVPAIIGRSSSMREIRKKILKLASGTYPVSILLVGEDGTGKELIARSIHATGPRSERPFIRISCSKAHPEGIEKDLFGTVDSGSRHDRRQPAGAFASVDGGVLFMDGLDVLPLKVQERILQVLRSNLSGQKGVAAGMNSFQMICGTSGDLRGRIKEGTFSKDLFHELTMQVIHVPPLRRRKQDILLLAYHFMEEFARQMQKELRGIDGGAQKLLQSHDYRTSNVRELKNVIERAVLETGGPVITARDIIFTDELLAGPPVSRDPGETTRKQDGNFLLLNNDLVTDLLERTRGRKLSIKDKRPYYRVLAELERKLILLSLQRCDWKIKPAAELLGINHLSLRSKLMAMLKLFLDEADGDVIAAARNNGIPQKFFTSKLHLLESR